MTLPCPACSDAEFVELEGLFGDGRTLPVRFDCPKCGAELEATHTIRLHRVEKCEDGSCAMCQVAGSHD